MCPGDTSSSSTDEESWERDYSRRCCPHRVTWALILANLGWFVAMMGLQKHPWTFAPLAENPFIGPPAASLIGFGGLSPALVRAENEWWRLGSCCFVHAGVIHLVLNVMSLKNLGSELEGLFGSWKVLLIYVSTGLFGSACSILFAQDKLLVGASGAILGLFGGFWSTLVQISCYQGCCILCGHTCRLFLQTAILVVLSLLPMVNAWAHFGGLLLGFLLGNSLLVRMYGDHSRIRKRQAFVATVSLLAAIAVCFTTSTAILQRIDVYQVLPALRQVNCFDTPFWNCCQFSGAACAIGQKPTTSGLQYYLICAKDMPESARSYVPTVGQNHFTPAANQTMYGPYKEQPDICDCLARCGSTPLPL